MGDEPDSASPPTKGLARIALAVAGGLTVGAIAGSVVQQRRQQAASAAAAARVAELREQVAAAQAELEAEQARHEETRAARSKVQERLDYEHRQRDALDDHLSIGKRPVWTVRRREAPWPKGSSRGARGRWIRDSNLRHVRCVRRLAAKQKGLERVMDDAMLKRLAKAGRLRPASGKRYTFAPALAKDRNKRLLRPSADKVLAEVARRFQRRVRDHGGPRGAKLELISALRTHAHNVKQGRKGDSTHEWGLAFDLGHRHWRFEVPGARVCQQDADLLEVVLGRLLAKMQREKKLMVFEHDHHFHVTACSP